MKWYVPLRLDYKVLRLSLCVSSASFCLCTCNTKSLKYTFQYEFSQFTDIVLHEFWVTRTSINSCSGPTVSWTSWFKFHVHLWGHRVHGNKRKYKKSSRQTSRTPPSRLFITPSLTSYRHKPEHKTWQRGCTEGRGPSELTNNRLQASSSYTSDYCTQPWKKHRLSKLKIQDQIHKTWRT